jgi:glycosyltransferase involved in cell wall biosynthesis
MRFVITRREGLDIPDGINAFIFSLAEALMDLGHVVDVITSAESSLEQVKLFFRVRRYPTLFSLTNEKNPSHARILHAWLTSGRSLIGELRPDFVMINGVLPIALSRHSCAVSHDLEKRWNYGNAFRRLYKIVAYRFSQSTVATCTELRHALARELFRQEQSIDLIPTCLSLGNYVGAPANGRSTAILHLGTALYKNPLATIHAFARLNDEDARLFITGGIGAGLREALARLDHNTRSRIECLGFISAQELTRLLSTVRLVSVPSVYNTPVASPTALEALACGTPVVGSPSISADLLREDVNGYRIAPAETDMMCSRFEQLLYNDECWKRLSEGAYSTVSRFSNSVVAANYVRLAERVIGG